MMSSPGVSWSSSQSGHLVRERLLALLCLAALSYPGFACAQTVDRLSPEVRKYLRVKTTKVVLEHVRIIDGTGAPPTSDRNITIENGKIAAIGPGADEAQGNDDSVLDLHGHSVIPGIVDMHGHLWFFARPNLRPDGSYDRPTPATQMSFSAPLLYLANGVTTVRTAGSVGPLTDLNLRRDIENGVVTGPHLDVTGPYLDGPGAVGLRPQILSGADDARETVSFWADHGVTSFKAYAHITRAALSAVIAEAHKRGLKVTGHLCSVTYEEAADMGIDNLEHGFFPNTQLDPGKKPDTCSDSAGDYTLEHLSAEQVARLIARLVTNHVAITSTLPSAAAYVPALNPTDGRALPLKAATLAAMSAAARDGYRMDFERARDRSKDAQLLRRDMDLERAFAAAGGLLMAGSDPVGLGGLVPGFATHREIELLVEAGFAPVQAIQIATLNGAIFLGRQQQIGSIAIGKNADLLVVKGDPASHITDIENVQLVFKDGAGYDSQKLLDAASGHYGEF